MDAQGRGNSDVVTKVCRDVGEKVTAHYIKFVLGVDDSGGIAAGTCNLGSR